MFINQLEIYNFRAFSGKNREQDENGNIIEKDIHYKFNFVKGLNCIAGHNGIGKSTILAMLGNCGELKEDFATHLNGSKFCGDYKDIIKGNPAHDPTGRVCTIHFSELPSNYSYSETYVESLEFRATFQSNNTRYRLIPVKNQNRKTEAKLIWPVYYMGLSRLYPVGESSKIYHYVLSEDILNEIKDEYKKIIPSQNDYLSVSTVRITGTKKKQGVGVSTEKYSYEANSAGQDNIGQILLSVLSFKKLKEKLGNEYFGGLLLIDEIDASLHPAAQLKLLDYLYKQSQELSLQIIFTSHSINVIDHLINKKDKKDIVNIIYINTCYGSVDIRENPTSRFVHNNLTESYTGIPVSVKFTLLTEDDVARKYLKTILDYKDFRYNNKLIIPDMNIGWAQIIKLVTHDFYKFKDVIVVLDPDLNNEKNKKDLEDKLRGTKYKINTRNSSIFILPGNVCIETMIWNWIYNLDIGHKLFKEPYFQNEGIAKINIINQGPNTTHYDNIESTLHKVKQWYKDNEHLMDIIMHYMIEELDKNGELDIFYDNFNKFVEMLVYSK